MKNGASRQPTEQPAPSISADFLTGSTLVGLERIRTRLLDLTKRNKLLNFRHSNALSLRVVNVSVDAVYRRLRDNERLAFLPVPEPDIGEGETPSAKDYADKLGWNTSLDLDEASADNEARSLPVLHYQEQLDTISRKIASAANTAIEESGTNMLHLVFGFLEWYESEDSQQPRIAPLITLPVIIERIGGKGKALQATLEYSGEDVEANLSLVERLRQDFGLEIPVLDDDDTPDRYFEKFEEILKLKKRWSMRRQITLALLSFGKLLMYRDLNPKTWPSDQTITSHPVVRELFEGSKNPKITLAEEYPIDDPELKEDIPHIILDADSSQHSALVHALRGQSLVIEGPPGTGKSQTITNLIAASLAKGKTILFVSEKLAALEVVRRRLDDAGLGIFCLEVHSHKTKKGALLNDLAQRLKMRGHFKDPRDIDYYLSVVHEKKRLLTQYASLINKTIEPFKATVFEIVWARDRYGQDIATANRQHLGEIILPVVVQYTQKQFREMEQFLGVYEQHLTAVLTLCKSIDQHPWAWITKPLGFEEEQRVLGLLGEFVASVRKADECCKHLQDAAGITLPQTPHGFEDASRTLAVLPNSGVPLIEDLLVPCQTATNRGKLAEFIGHVESFRRGYEHLSASASNVSSLLDVQTGDKLSSALESLREWGLEGRSVAEIKELLEVSNETAKLLGEAYSSFCTLLDVVGFSAPHTLSSATFLLETIRIIETAPFERLHFRQQAFESEGTKSMLQMASQEATVLKDTEASLSKEFDLSLGAGMYTPAQLLECAAVIDGASFWKRLIGGEYRGAIKAYRCIAIDEKKATRANMSRALRIVADYAQKRAQFDNHAAYREMLGIHFQGVHSPWDDLHRVLHWYEDVFVALPEHEINSEPFRRFVFTAKIDRLKAIKINVSSLRDDRSTLGQIVSRVMDFTRSVPSQRSLMVSGSFEEIRGHLKKLSRELSQILQTIDLVGINNEVSLRNIPNILAVARQCRNTMDTIQAAAELSALIGGIYCGINTDIETIKNTVQFAESITSGSLPQKTIEWLLCPEYGTHLTELRVWLSTARSCGEKLQLLAGELAAISGSVFWGGSHKNPWDSLRALAEYALANREELSRWNHFLRVRIETRKLEVDKLTTLAETRQLKPDELGPAFRFVFHNTLARSVFAEHAELSQVTGVTQDQLRNQFAAADKEAIRLYSERVAALIDQRQIPYGNQSGPVRTWTDMALIMNEINKQKRHIPIRQLIRRAGNALVALKPCFMMGPLSVAQYLAPGHLKFDLVVMDEASQLKPEDAIGALARGGQVVIVGDPKQLPPTNFFQRVSLDADEDNADDSVTVAEEGESILDVASTLFQPVRRLRWHYRSRHHSLIAFSNDEFYQRDLIIFPSAYHDDPSLGVKYRCVRDGVFENRRNPPEAAVVVEAVLEHMRQHPDESLGVVTLNFEQRELVEELLDRRLRDDPAAIAYQERMKGGQETLFVKNLENVQGDERDVVFISTTYGPDERGNQFQRFGPINGPNGHRRLNVLFTRAKKRIVVFSSLDPDRIQATASSSWGLRALKQYLIFARTGILQKANDGLSQSTNDFERAVGAVLKEKGYAVVPQVGVAGFFIDLGVRHPVKAGAFLLGIECDGASYHSGRSARDRDRLRQEILTNLGWKIHRIWSTDWFKSRDSEVRRMLRRIEELLESDCLAEEDDERQYSPQSLHVRGLLD
jgi:very-short-patch-repair endonuclease